MFCLTIHLLNDICIASNLGLLWIKLLWTFMDKCLHENKLLFLWDICPRVQLLGYMLSPFLVLKGTAKVFFRVAVLFFTFPPAMYEWSSFSAFWSLFGVITLFFFTLSVRYVVILHCGFTLHLSDGWSYWTSFHVLFCHLDILFNKTSVHIVCQFSKWILSFCWLLRVLYIF